MRYALLALCGLSVLNVYMLAVRSATHQPHAALREAAARAADNERALGDALRAADRQTEALRGLLGEGGAPSAPSASGREAATQPSARPWLRIVMPCHSRASGVNYLRPTLASILEQLPRGDPLRALVDVLVVNTDKRPSENTAFASVRAELAGEPLVHFAELGPGARARKAPPQLFKRVKPRVQQQTLDLAEVFATAEGLAAQPELILAAEDDWLLCPSGLLAILHLVRTASALDPNWIALRCSYGFNGIVLRAADLPSLRGHLAAHYARRPPDHLVFEWFSGEWHAKQKLPGHAYAHGRSFRVYRHNVWYHIGYVSTLSQPADRHTPRCYELLYDWLLPAEAFKRADCPDDDVWPCTPSAGGALGAPGALFERFGRVEFALGKRDDTGKVPAGEPLKQRVVELSMPSEPRAARGARRSLAAGARTANRTRTVVATAVVTGQLNESCDAACVRSGAGRCSLAELRALNTCDELERNFACRGCSPSQGRDQPAHVDDGASPESLPGHCVYNSPMHEELVFDCAASHELTRRLCACTRLSAAEGRR